MGTVGSPKSLQKRGTETQPWSNLFGCPPSQGMPRKGFNSGLEAPASTLSSGSAPYQAHPGCHHAPSSSPASAGTVLIQNWIGIPFSCPQKAIPHCSPAATTKGKPDPKRSFASSRLGPSLCGDAPSGQHLGGAGDRFAQLQPAPHPAAPTPTHLAPHPGGVGTLSPAEQTFWAGGWRGEAPSGAGGGSAERRCHPAAAGRAAGSPRLPGSPGASTGPPPLDFFHSRHQFNTPPPISHLSCGVMEQPCPV